jgi:hypothetical protein
MRAIVGGVLLVTLALCSDAAWAGTTDVGIAGGISGRFPDMNHRINRSGYTFQVGMTGVRYEGRVARTVVEVKQSNRCTIWLALRDVVVTIERTEIVGQPGRALCGPLQVTLGGTRDLWVAFDIEEKVGQNESSFVLAATRSELPPDNWQVGTPMWVQTSGLGMNRGNVIEGLRNGLVKNRERFAERMMNVGPQMLAQLPALADKLPPLLTASANASRPRLAEASRLDERSAIAASDR